jgi:hypothetical protein|tara:strand:+ start:3025 stop:3411 length:387 start_codon:yes stop_codon:yes gene_type:complete
MELNGTILFLIMVVIIQNLQRTGPRMLEVNGVKNSPTRVKRDGRKRKVKEVDKNGMKIGIKNVKLFKKRKTKKEMILMRMSPTETILKNKIARNGAKTLKLTKNGMKNGVKYIEMINVKNGVTNGKLI